MKKNAVIKFAATVLLITGCVTGCGILHKHAYTWTEKTPSACESTGLEENICECGEISETREIPATGHSFGDWEVVNEATCETDGQRKCVCSVCGKVTTETIKSTGEHTWSDWVITRPETFEEDGERARTCSVCGKTEQKTLSSSSVTPSLEPNTALVTYNGKTKLFYLSNAQYKKGSEWIDNRKNTWQNYDKIEWVNFYYYDEQGLNASNVRLSIDTYDYVKAHDIITQKDADEHKWISFSISFDTLDYLYVEYDTRLNNNKNDYRIEFLEVDRKNETFHVLITCRPHENNTGKVIDLKVEAIFKIGAVHPVADAHGDAKNTNSSAKIRGITRKSGSGGSSSSYTDTDNNNSDITNPGSGNSSSSNNDGYSVNTKHVCGGCNGKKTHTCPVCNGSQKCNSCYGDGFFLDRKCTTCYGKGKCFNCNGKGEVKCSTCNGKGYRY